MKLRHARRLILLLTLMLGIGASAARAEEYVELAAAYPMARFDAECEELRRELVELEPMEALVRLEQYFAEHENSGCRFFQVEDWIRKTERSMIRLVDTEGEVEPQWSLRCYEVETRTTVCRGFHADDLWRLVDRGLPPLRKPSGEVMLDLEIPGAQIVGVYKARLIDRWDDEHPRPLAVRDGRVDLGQVDPGTALIAIVHLDADWKYAPYSKIVWLF